MLCWGRIRKHNFMDTNNKKLLPAGTKEKESETRGGGFMPFVSGLIIGAAVVGGAWYFAPSDSSSPDDESSTTAQDDSFNQGVTSVTTTPRVTTTANQNGEALVVTNQVAGNTVFVDSATLTGVSWVVVRTADGARILGAARLADSGFEIPVSLLAPTVAGQQYEVVIFIDDGDLAFDHRLDALVSGVSAPFTAL